MLAHRASSPMLRPHGLLDEREQGRPRAHHESTAARHEPRVPTPTVCRSGPFGHSCEGCAGSTHANGLLNAPLRLTTCVSGGTIWAPAGERCGGGPNGIRTRVPTSPHVFANISRTCDMLS